MDIIDVILGRALSSSGQIETYAAMAQKAVQKAQTALTQAQAIIDHGTEVTDAADAALTAAETASETATTVAAELEQLKSDITAAATTIVDQRITNLLEVTNVNVAENSAAIESLWYHIQYLHHLIPLVSTYNQGEDTPAEGITSSVIGNRLTVSSTGVADNTVIPFGDVDPTQLKDGHRYRYIMHVVSGDNAANDLAISITNNDIVIHDDSERLSNGDQRVDFTYVAGQQPDFNYIVGANQTFTNDVVEFYLLDLTEHDFDDVMGEDAVPQAVKDYIAAIKAELEEEIAEGGGGSGGSIHFDVDDNGQLIVVGPDGTITPCGVTLDELIDSLIKTDSYKLKGTVGTEIDYEAKTFNHTQDAELNHTTADFDKYPMFGGRMRCNVNDNGEITAFYGQTGYKDDGSNGQVMVYQPKFYYHRKILKTHEIAERGTAIDKELLVLSDKKKNDLFKVHPIFINSRGEELDYVLLPAYEGSMYDASAADYDRTSTLTIDYSADKLCSVGESKPISGVGRSDFTMMNTERLAQNRGAGWHITTMAAESVTQMLMMTEFASTNVQTAVERGLVDLSNIISTNCASITGSTSSLGNATGAAATTINEINGTYTSYDTEGKRAISYRGVENPWGNLWTYAAGVCAVGDGTKYGGQLHIAKGYNYNITANDTSNYIALPILLPNNSSWAYRFGYCGDNYDWIFIPIDCSDRDANSALPIGDRLWTTASVNALKPCLIGGTTSASDSGGIFYYNFDNRSMSEGGYSIGANLMFIPIKNNIYSNNIAKWQEIMGV